MWRKTTFLLFITHLAIVLSYGSQEFLGFLNGNNRFAASVYKEILTDTRKDNFFVSPFSVGLVLAAAQSGAKHETASEILQALQQPANHQMSKAVERLQQKQPYTLHTVNKIYIKDSYRINPTFIQTVQDLYQTQTENIDFTQQREAAETINLWVEQQTNHKIRGLLDSNSINWQTRAILLNALYFQANWSMPFEGFLTKKLDFTTFSNKIKVNTMRDHNNDYKYFESAELDAKFLEIPFEGENASMVIVLPNQDYGLRKLETQIEKVFDQHAFTLEAVNVAIPKFKIQNKWDFKKILKRLRMVSAFRDDSADFSKIAGVKGDIFINKVIQQCFVDVNEGGVEAAAATYVDAIVPLSGSFPTQPPKQFKVDHPFLFYIKVQDIVLFVGRVTRPNY